MDTSVKDMDDFCIHWGAWTRRYPSTFPLQTMGYVRQKKNWIRTTFNSVNFSFILSGHGEYWQDGKLWEVKAPCVLTQWPGEPLEYGPTEGARVWEELFLIFQANTFERFSQCGFLRTQKPCWNIASPLSWREILLEVIHLGAKPLEQNADRLDRLCEQLVLESLMHQQSEAPPPRSLTIGKIQKEIRENLSGWPDLDACARRLGASQATFRRLWMREVGIPPARFADECKMKEACRRLVETNLAVAEIAFSLGYEDALYFSRRFRAKIGCSATQYRETHGMELT